MTSRVRPLTPAACQSAEAATEVGFAPPILALPTTPSRLPSRSTSMRIGPARIGRPSAVICAHNPLGASWCSRSTVLIVCPCTVIGVNGGMTMSSLPILFPSHGKSPRSWKAAVLHRLGRRHGGVQVQARLVQAVVQVLEGLGPHRDGELRTRLGCGGEDRVAADLRHDREPCRLDPFTPFMAGELDLPADDARRGVELEAKLQPPLPRWRCPPAPRASPSAWSATSRRGGGGTAPSAPVTRISASAG